MGTRADFYVGKGLLSEWIGSIEYDGHPDRIPESILVSRTLNSFVKNVNKFICERKRDNTYKDGISKEDGWSWPWDSSRHTDYSYAIDGNKVWASCYGHEWFDPLCNNISENLNGVEVVFPHMITNKLFKVVSIL